MWSTTVVQLMLHRIMALRGLQAINGTAQFGAAVATLAEFISQIL